MGNFCCSKESRNRDSFVSMTATPRLNLEVSSIKFSKNMKLVFEINEECRIIDNSYKYNGDIRLLKRAIVSNLKKLNLSCDMKLIDQVLDDVPRVVMSIRISRGELWFEWGGGYNSPSGIKENEIGMMISKLRLIELERNLSFDRMVYRKVIINLDYDFTRCYYRCYNIFGEEFKIQANYNKTMKEVLNEYGLFINSCHDMVRMGEFRGNLVSENQYDQNI